MPLLFHWINLVLRLNEPVVLRCICCYPQFMHAAWSNIEAVARDLCERQLRAAGAGASALSTAVDRYWHCIAAEIEAGLIDEHGNPIGGLRNPYVDPISLLQVELLRDWRAAGRPDDARFRALAATVNGIAAGVQNTG